MSPIFTGAFSEHRRWRRGKLIKRDATYWVPLILLCLGSRIEEILLLKRTDVLLRNGYYCFALNQGPEQIGKTKSSKRTLPIPQLLLELGFVEWFQALPEDHGILLFPEAAWRSSTADVTSAFSKHLRRVLSRLGVADFDEDLYAARMTFSSMLNAASVPEGQRQAIAGHQSGSILNCHYTAHNVGDLKIAMDKANFQVEIRYRKEYGFPVICGCSLKKEAAFRAEVTLADNNAAAMIRLFNETSAQPVFGYDRAEASSLSDRKARATELRRKIGESPVKLPQNGSRRVAFEHFLALGSA